MGFFSKLFEKKECAFCGEEAGLIGNRKLEDGNMCSKCAKKLSPWFSDRRNSTVAEIGEQLAYREQNAKELEQFRIDRVIGENYRMYIEEENGIPKRFFISSATKPLETNPDIVSFKDVMTCVGDVRMDKKELKERTEDGQMVSYSPRRFEYTYWFDVELTIINNPYFDKMKMQLNSSPVTIKVEEDDRSDFGWDDVLFGTPRKDDPTRDRRYRELHKQMTEIEQIAEFARTHAHAGATMERVEMPIHEEVVVETPAAPKFCPNCGAPNKGGKFCDSCGSKF